MDPKWVEKYPHLYGPNAKDPDEGQGDVECEDFIAKLCAKYTGFGGTFSTWGERHSFIVGAQIGYLDVAASVDVPPVPEFWIKESQYWYTGIIMGRSAKKLEDASGQNVKILAAVASFFAVIGTVIGPKILALFGVS